MKRVCLCILTKHNICIGVDRYCRQVLGRHEAPELEGEQYKEEDATRDREDGPVHGSIGQEGLVHSAVHIKLLQGV